MDLKLARNEASHERVTALEIEIDVMKVDQNVLESQTAEQRVAAYALRDRKHDRKCAAKELAEEAQRVAKAAAKIAERDHKRAAKELTEEAQCVTKIAAKELAEEAQRVVKAAAKIAERDRKRAEKEAEDESRAHLQWSLWSLERAG